MTSIVAPAVIRAPVMPQRTRLLLVGAAALACLLCLCALLFCNPILGRADNGDQYRVLRDAGLQAPSNSQFVEVWTRYACVDAQGIPASTGSVLSSLIARPACAFADELPVQLFGAVYTAIHFLGVVLFLVGLSRSFGVAGFVLSACVLLLQALQPYYISFFNTFFEEAAMFAFASLVLGVAAFRASRTAREPVEWLAALSILALAFTKVVHLIFLPLLLGIRGRRWLMLGLCLAALVVVAGQTRKAAHYQTPNAFNRLFLGLLPTATPETTAAILDETGLQDQRGFVGEGYWPRGHSDLSPAQKQQLTQSAGLLDVALLYLRHPGAGVAAVGELARRTATASAEIPYLAMSNGGTWAAESATAAPLKVFYRALAQAAGTIALVALALHLLIALVLRHRDLLLLGIALAAYPGFVLLGDGFYEFEKHLLLFLYAAPLGSLLALQAAAEVRRCASSAVE